MGSLIRTFLLPLFLAAPMLTSAQQAGKLRLVIDPGASYWFVLDHQFRLQQREVELAAGPHHFTFWAPERMMVDTTLNVEAGRTKDILLRLPYSTAFMVYQRDVRSYRNEMKVERVLPAVVTAGVLVYTGLKWSKYKKAHDALDADRDDYNSSPSPFQISQIKDVDIPQHKDDFQKAQRNLYIATGLSVLCVGATAYLFHRSGKRPVPEFHDAEKVKFDGLVWVPGPNGGQWMTGLTLNLARK